MKKTSPVFKADVQSKGVPPHEWVEVYFADPAELRRFAECLVAMADTDAFDHVHLQDHGVTRDSPEKGVEIVFLVKQGDSAETGDEPAATL